MVVTNAPPRSSVCPEGSDWTTVVPIAMVPSGVQEGCVNITEWLGVFGLREACIPGFFGPSFGLALVPLLGPIADSVRLELYDGPGIETAR